MEDLGERISFLTLREGVRVYSSDGQELGRVERVMADTDANMFDGIVIDTSVLPGGHRFVDAPEVGEIYENGVVLKITAATAKHLGEPERNPAVMEVGAEDLVGDRRGGGLRGVWDRLTGRR